MLDEMISPVVAVGLCARGIDTLAVQDEPALRGAADASLLAFALAHRRVVVTNTIRDFRLLGSTARRLGTTHGGVILVSSNELCSRHAAGRMIEALAALAATYPLDDDPRGRELWL